MPSPAPHQLPPLFEPSRFAGHFAMALRRADIPVAPERAALFLTTLRLSPPVDRDALYWAARLSFVTGHEQLGAFDRTFQSIFGGALDPANQRGDPGNPPLDDARPPRSAPYPPAPGARSMPGSPRGGIAHAHHAEAGEPQAATPITLRGLSSADEALAHKDFGTFGLDDLAALDRIAASLVLSTPPRRTRRREADSTGRHVDLRRSLRQSLRTGAEPINLARTRNRVTRRRLVLLCDISASMEPYTLAYLRVFARLCARPNQAAGNKVEIFVFSTRLTRLTTQLRHTDPDAALRRAGATAPDWSGGTRIGRSLAEFTDRFGRRGMARGAVLVVFSDGWEGEDPAQVGRQMARLHRLARRIVWVNPRKAAPGYAPLASGMAAALPFCDAFVSGHTLAALADLVQAIAAPAITGRT